MVGQYKEHLDNVMQREVSRADFLKFLVIALLSVIGVVGFFRNLHEALPAKAVLKKSAPSGYGRSAYGR